MAVFVKTVLYMTFDLDLYLQYIYHIDLDDKVEIKVCNFEGVGTKWKGGMGIREGQDSSVVLKIGIALLLKNI